jgi:hypothetical protein
VLNLRRRPYHLLAAVVALCVPYNSACAQDPPPATLPAPVARPAAPPGLRQELERSDYDPAQRGPLLVVLPSQLPVIPSPPSRQVAAPTLAAIADAHARRVQKAGGLTTLAPATMTVINTHPGAPRPLADLPAFSTRSTPRNGRRS